MSRQDCSTDSICIHDPSMPPLILTRWCHAAQRETRRLLSTPFMTELTLVLEHSLRMLGVPPPYPQADQIALCFAAVVTTLVTYFLLFGKRHRRRRKLLAKELREARRRVSELEEKLLQMEMKDEGGRGKGRKPVRIWMDGCFDMMHYGHMNAFRQGKALGTYLVVGVNSDQTIIACKGPPVMSDSERLTAVEGCRFVDEVVKDVPYVMNESYLRKVIDKYKIDYVVHGDDPCIVNGKDVYELPQKMGKYQTIARTEGISTTDIVGRMLLMSTRHHQQTHQQTDGSITGQLASDGQLSQQNLESPAESQFYRRTRFLTTSRMIRLFSVGMKSGPPNKDTKVVYVDGSWDMLHAGHINILKKVKHASGAGVWLIVGVHNDQVVNRYRGSNFPIMNLHERVLSVLGCKYVDDVLIDAPYTITHEMIASLSISSVVHGVHKDDFRLMPDLGGPEEDPFKVPKELGIFREVGSDCDLSIREIIARIQKNQEQFLSKFSKKKKVEDEYYQQRYRREAVEAGARGGVIANGNGHA